VKAFSIRQPYAFAVVMGYKPVENRDWTWKNPGLKFRGRVLIHAGVKEERDDVDGVLRTIAQQTSRALSVVTEEYEAHRHLGAIVGAATIHDVVTEMDSPWFYGPVGLLVKDAKWCPPFPCKGQLGFFNVPPEVAEAIRGAPEKDRA
jgi:hypothetical protein